MSSATKLARSTIRQLIELGISDLVLSPGSRSAPLAIAAYDAKEKGLLRLHVRIDERGAAFFALGLSKASGKYVPVLCTSGTAAANFLPAVLEAHHSDVKLLLLTADRPARLRKTGSNQTTLQSGIFANFVRREVDTATPIDLAHLLGGSGPVHVNFQFDEPLLPESNESWLTGIHFHTNEAQPHQELMIDVPTTRNLVIVGHDRAGFEVAPIERLARELGAPVIAEDPLSFKDAIAHAPIILSDERVRSELATELVVVIGRTTLSRPINTYLANATQVVVIDPRTKGIDTERTADRIFHVIPRVKSSVAPDSEWVAKWNTYSELARSAQDSLPEWSEGRIAQLIAADLERDTALFISSSRPIRDLEAFAEPRDGVITYANRGLAGIDGNISTALGIASYHDETVAVIGDLAFLHDLSALTNPTGEVLTLIVIDNNGGGIFSMLPQRGIAGFEELFGTPHDRDLAGICAGFGISHEVVRDLKGLHIALQRIHPNLHIIIAKVPDRETNATEVAKVVQRYSGSVSL